MFYALLAGASAEPQQAQPKLETVTLKVGGTAVLAEVADEPHEQQAGLMFREKLEDGHGMLFIMPQVGPASFWMRNTLIPLSIGYISENGRLLEVHQMKPKDETSVPSRSKKVKYALEVPEGWFSRNGIFPGELITGLPVLNPEVSGK